MDREKRSLSVYVMVFMMLFGSSMSAGSRVPRWIACESPTDIQSRVGRFNFPAADYSWTANVPTRCLLLCNTNSFTYALTRDALVGFDCHCTNGVPPPYTDQEYATTFSTCDVTCPGEAFAPCGSSVGDFVWYENATEDSTAIMINDCYDETTITDLEACRVIRRTTALTMGRSINESFHEIDFVDPCSTNNGGCDDPEAMCTFDNSTGFRTCECGDGSASNLTGDNIPGFECLDIDECSTGTHDCNDTFSTCVNEQPGFRCSCNIGYVDRSMNTTNDPGRICVPVFNECYFGTFPECHPLALCTNNNPPPGHDCVCKDGYDGDGLLSGSGCNNVNECDDVPGVCGVNTICSDTTGSFTCICAEGFILSSGNVCSQPYATRECGTDEPTGLDRRVAYGFACSVAVLFDCNDTVLLPEPDRQRIVTQGTGPYATCDANQLVSTFSSDVLDDSNEFINNGGINLLEPQVQCDQDTFSIRFSSEPAFALGFSLDNLFLGGGGDFDTAEGMYKNQPECQGQVWFERGFQYRFETPTATEECGTMHTVQGNQIIYSATVRGQIGESGPVISRSRNFYVTFLCVTDKIKTVTSEPLLVFDLNRKKRGIRSAKAMKMSGSQQLLSMDLWQDSSFTDVYEPSIQLHASELIYVKISWEDAPTESGLRVRPLRCWQTLTADGTGNRYKHIVANGCNENQWKLNGNVRITSQEDNSFRFGFPVTSFDGGNENIYVSCLVDMSDSQFTKRCENLITSESSFHGDDQITVITVGPLSVVDVCGGRLRGGCDHYCSVTKEATALCYCEKGFEIDPEDPRQCLLSSAARASSTSQVFWYYYVIPIIILAFIALVVAFVILRSKSKSNEGEYSLKVAESEEIVID